MTAHDEGRHDGTHTLDRAYWAKTCPACAALYDPKTWIPLMPRKEPHGPRLH